MPSHASRSRSRTIGIAAAIAGALGALTALASCVIADPPPELPALPRHHPIIVKGSLVPPYGKILAEIPPSFVIPVELIDPDTSFEYGVFFDYDSSNPRQPPDVTSHGPQAPTPATVDGGIYSFPFQIDPASFDPMICHRIELLVALSFDRQFPHTPDSYGADSVVWIYNPAGEPNGCPYYDAGGADGAMPQQDARIIPPTDAGGS